MTGQFNAIKNEDGSLQITVETKDQPLKYQIEGQLVDIGVYDNVIVQTINKDNVETFRNLVKSEWTKNEENIERIKEMLEKLSDVDVNMLPQSMLTGLDKYLGKKASKALKSELKHLNNYMERVFQKLSAEKQLKQLEEQKPKLEEQMTKIELLL